MPSMLDRCTSAVTAKRALQRQLSAETADSPEADRAIAEAVLAEMTSPTPEMLQQGKYALRSGTFDNAWEAAMGRVGG